MTWEPKHCNYHWSNRAGNKVDGINSYFRPTEGVVLHLCKGQTHRKVVVLNCIAIGMSLSISFEPSNSSWMTNGSMGERVIAQTENYFHWPITLQLMMALRTNCFMLTEFWWDFTFEDCSHIRMHRHYIFCGWYLFQDIFEDCRFLCLKDMKGVLLNCLLQRTVPHKTASSRNWFLTIKGHATWH